MIAAISQLAFTHSVATLHADTGGSALLPDLHKPYGAAFLLLGGLLVVESLAGSVWHRSRLRTLIWPAALMAVGFGILVVTYAGPSEPWIHYLLGALFIAGGAFEARYRLHQITRTSADIVVVSSLVLGALLIGPIHYEGAIVSASAIRHLLMGPTAVALAGARLGQSFRPSSMAMAAVFGMLFMTFALQLLLIPTDHHA